MADVAGGAAEELLLLFRRVEGPARRARASRLLDDGMGGRPAWRLGTDVDLWELSDVDLWELSDVTGADDDEPAAAAATCPVGDGRRVRLLAVVVADAYRRRGVGRRMVEDVADALRRSGVLVVVAAVPAAHAPAMVVLQQAGFRPTHVERGSPEAGKHDVVWFDVAL